MQYINTIKSKKSIISLENSMDGMLTFELEGNTMYKKSDGTYTDIWEQGCTLESVGEAEGNKIEVLSQSKNLFNLNEKPNYIQMATYTLDSNNITITSDRTGAGASIARWELKLKPNTQYRFSTKSTRTGTNGGGVYIDNSQYIIIYAGQNVLNPNITFTSLNDGIIRLWFYGETNNLIAGNSATYTNIQLEEGSIATPYEPYRENKINILATLRGLPNGVRDIASGNTITRKLGVRAYQSGDENNSNVMTDRINTIYQLPTPVVENLIVQKGDI